MPKEKMTEVENDLNTSFILLIFKKEKVIEIWDTTPNHQKINTFPFQYGSIQYGPKLTSEEAKIPEGFYQSIAINENEIQLDFPNDFDRKKAKADHRNLDKASFYIRPNPPTANQIGLNPSDFSALQKMLKNQPSTDIIILPHRLDKNRHFNSCTYCPNWYLELYLALEKRMQPFQ